MKHFILGKADINFVWAITTHTGLELPLSTLFPEGHIRVWYSRGTGQSEVDSIEVNGNLVSWTLKAEDQKFFGSYSVKMELFNSEGVLVRELIHNNTFALQRCGDASVYRSRQAEMGEDESIELHTSVYVTKTEYNKDDVDALFAKLQSQITPLAEKTQHISVEEDETTINSDLTINGYTAIHDDLNVSGEVGAAEVRAGEVYYRDEAGNEHLVEEDVKDLRENLARKQGKLKAGAGVSISPDDIISVTGVGEGAVRYDKQQSITQDQQRVARQNIGAAGSSDINNIHSRIDSIDRDLRAEVDRARLSEGVLSDNLEVVSQTANTAEEQAYIAKAIAEGKSRAIVFDWKWEMEEWLEDPDHRAELHVGDNLYIIDTNVPDYWWDGTQAQPLETQKVDLSEYSKTIKLLHCATSSPQDRLAETFNRVLSNQDKHVRFLYESSGSNFQEVIFARVTAAGSETPNHCQINYHERLYRDSAWHECGCNLVIHKNDDGTYECWLDRVEAAKVEQLDAVSQIAQAAKTAADDAGALASQAKADLVKYGNAFVAEYGVTPYQDVLDAFNAGKALFVRIFYDTVNASIMSLGGYWQDSGKLNFKFYCYSKDIAGFMGVYIMSNGVWGRYSNTSFQDASYRQTTITESDTNYPTSAAVVRYAAKKEELTELSLKVGKLETAIVKDLESTSKTIEAVAKTNYIFGVLESLAVTFPASGNDGEMIDILCKSGETAMTLVVDGNWKGENFAPSANSVVEINAVWYAVEGKWMVLFNEIAL